MANLYSSTSVNGYNANPPPDDGTQVSTNQITWAGIKTKLGDPLNTFASSVDSNISSAFGKTLDGASVVSTAVDYAATAADQGRVINVSVSGKTVTTPDAGTVGAPFLFGVHNTSAGSINLAPNATNSQQIDGAAATLVVQAGGSCIVKTDGTNWFTVGYKPGSNALAANNYGFDSPINANISCSVGSNLLTVALKTKAGNDPSASDPVLVPFRDTTLTAGDPIWVTQTAALSISTNATGASLGSQNSKPFRFWILLFNNGGSLALALWHSGAGALSVALNPLNEGTLQSTTGISAGATSAGVFYTPNGTTLTSKAFRILGYLEYTSGLTTAGTYAAAPDIVQLFGPGVRKPGDAIQRVYATATGTTSLSSVTMTATNTTANITPTSTTSVISARATGTISGTDGSGSVRAQLGRTSNSNLFGSNLSQEVQSVIAQTNAALEGWDVPNTTSSTAYTVFGAATAGTGAWLGTFNSIVTQSTIVLEELMA